MSTFDVKIDTLMAAAEALQKAIENFDIAAEQAGTAGDVVCADWEGAAKEKFQQEQDRVKQWYRQMSAAAQTGVSLLQEIARQYVEADGAAAGSI